MITLEYRKCEYTAPPQVVVQPKEPARSVDARDVEFDRYMIVYSDSAGCEGAALAARSSLSALMLGDNQVGLAGGAYRAGATSIGCYSGDSLVGTINFYGESVAAPQSCIAPDGLLVIWYPLAAFPQILNILQSERHLGLSVVCTALDGSRLTPAMGSLLTLPRPVGQKDSEADASQLVPRSSLSSILFSGGWK